MQQEEILLMNCPLPIRRTEALQIGITKKIEYLLHYLSEYDEAIIDKKKFFAQIGLDELVDDQKLIFLRFAK